MNNQQALILYLLPYDYVQLFQGFPLLFKFLLPIPTAIIFHAQAMQEFEEVANGNLSDYSYQTEEPDEILEDIRESLREGFAEVLAMGKVLIDRLRYPMLSNDNSQETIEPQIAINEFEGILDEIRARQLDIDQIVQSFHQGDEHYSVFDEVDSGNRKYVVNETPVMLEVQVFQEEMPVESLQNDLQIEKRIEEVSLKL